MAKNIIYEQAFKEHDKLCKQLGVFISSNRRGAYLPIGILADQLTHPYENVILIGDAAGLTNAITGEGIYLALLSGYFAGKAYQINKNTFRTSFLSILSSTAEKVREIEQLSHKFYDDKLVRTLLYQLQTCPEYIANACDEVFNLGERSYQSFFMELKNLYR